MFFVVLVDGSGGPTQTPYRKGFRFKNILQINREDVLVNTMGYNESVVIYHPNFDHYIPSGAPPESKILWAPHNDSIFFMNSTSMDQLGYFLVHLNESQWWSIFSYQCPCYYDSTLHFMSGKSNITLRDGESADITIDGIDYLIKIVSLYKFTTLETYFIFDLPPYSGQSYFIERKD